MNFIYIGSLYPEKLMTELVKIKSHVDFPANNLQSALLCGLDKIYPNLKVISSSPVSAYPKIKKVLFKHHYFSHKGDDNKCDAYVGVLNLPVIRLFSRYFRVKKELRKSLKADEQNVVLSYGLHTPFLLAVWSMRKKISKTCVIVPDLPQFMSGKKQWLYRMAKSIDMTIINRCLKDIDKFVLLSPHMAEKLPISDKQTIVMDGIYQDEYFDVKDINKDSHKTILYTGDTAERCGVIELIEAFKQIDDRDYRLWIRGYGANIAHVSELIKDDERIVYFPAMPRAELLSLERKATVLVNPIRASQTFTRYYFPSKTMEYLASATPTVMYHLDCLSKEYDSHLHYVPEETIESLRDTLIRVCSQTKEARQRFGNDARTFILSNKNPDVQARRIADLLSD